jgi:hypothetical protein
MIHQYHILTFYATSVSYTLFPAFAEASMSHRVRPLSFKPHRLDGLSQRLIDSHYENNYGGAVRRLNSIDRQLADRPVHCAELPAERPEAEQRSPPIRHHTRSTSTVSAAAVS